MDSSDGDQVLSVASAANRDRWVIVDDQEDADPFKSGSEPATGHVFDGTPSALAGAAAVKNVNTADYELVGQTGKLTLQWDSVTVAPGQKAILMHFAFNQLDRYRARQAALRLAQLPPEALENLAADERAAILNFAIPADGVSTQPALPAVDVAVITGKVVSADGTTPIAKARVHLKSTSALYGRDYYVDADDSGNYEFRANTNGAASGVAIPLYSFNIDATHPKTGADTGLAQSDFVAPSTAVVKNLIFNNTGNVRGVVRRHNGALVGDAAVRLCDLTNAYACFSPIYNYDTTKASGTYLMAGSRPRDYGLHAEKAHPQQGNGLPILGQATVTITSGDTAVVDITMEATGTLTGLVRAANGDPVQNATVNLFYVSAQRGRERARQTSTDTAGRYRFFDVRAGDVAIEVTDPVTQARGDAAGAVVVDTEATVNATLLGFGAITVHVNYARGAPATNSRVTIQNGSIYATGQTDTNGVLTFNAAVGTYDVVAWHPDDPYQVDLKSTGSATVAAQGASASVTVTLKPAGIVRGTVIRPDGSTLASGFPYTIKPLSSSAVVNNANPRTEATGNYRFSPLKLGTWVITAYDPVLDRFADAEFVVAADGAEVIVDLRLEDNRIALPATLKDANRFPYDVQRDGKLVTGMASDINAFKNASQLEINGVVYTGDTSALLEATKRQFAITQPALIQGLRVTRKVFVPKGGYFARFLEVFENTTAAPITVDAKLTHGLPATTVLLNSSSGDASLTTADTWITTDDAKDGDPLIDPQQTSTAFLFGQTGASVTASQAAFAAAANGTDKAAILRWQNVTVPANGKAVLMHFAVQQINRAGATAAVVRLQQLPPEALTSLSASEVASIKNFTLPANAESVVTPLPSLTAGVNGRVFEGDARTPVVGVRVTAQSSHPLFNRVWGMQPDPVSPCYYIPGTVLPFQAGNNNVGSISSAPLPNAVPPVLGGTYRMNGQLTNDDSVAMPEGVATTVRAQAAQTCFSKYSGHSWTNLPSKVHTINPSVEQNIVFDSGVLTGTITGYNDFSVTGGRMYLSTDNIEAPDYHYITLGADGTYVYPGLAPGSYDVLADTQHPQATVRDLRGSRSNSVVTLGRITVTDLQLQPAGSVQGAILTANGEASVNALIEIRGLAAGQTYDQCVSGCVPQTLNMHTGKRAVNRSVRTDSLGRYNFSAIPTGSYALTITDPVSDGRKTVNLSVAEGQVLVQNVTLLGLGAINLTVTKANGTPLVDAIVYVFPAAQAAEEVAGRTNAQGKLTIANTPTGAFTIRVPDARFPSDPFFERKLTGSIATNGESQILTIAMKAVASVAVTVRNTDTNAVVVGAPVWITDVRGTQRFVGNTNAAGQVLTTAAPEGAFRLTVNANAPGARTFALLGSVAALDDGATVGATVAVTALLDQLGEARFEGERRLYGVSVSAGDTLRVSAFGEPRAPSPSLRRTRITVYDAANAVIASGYRYDDYSYNQSDVGSLDNIVAAANTTFTIAVQSDVASGDYALGAYRVTADINTAATAVRPFMSGAVQGVVTRANGNPAVNRVIEIQTAAPLALRTRVTTDASGNYRFEGVPAGAATIKALSSVGVTIVSRSVNLATAATVITQNLVLPAISQLTITVKLANGTNAPLDTRVDVTDAIGLVTLLTNASGQVATEIVGDASAKASDPAVYGNTVADTITASDAIALSLTLQFGADAGRVSGRVLNADGTPVVTSIELSLLNGGGLGYRNTNALGEFVFTNAFTYNEPLRLSAYDRVTERYFTYDFTLAEGTGRTGIVIRFPATASVVGRTVTQDGSSVANVRVCAIYESRPGSQIYKCAQSSADGSYAIASVPVGIPLEFRATLAQYLGSYSELTGTPVSVTVASAGAPYALGDLVFNAATMTVRAQPKILDFTDTYLSIQNAQGDTLAHQAASADSPLSMLLAPGTYFVKLRRGRGCASWGYSYYYFCTELSGRVVIVQNSAVEVIFKERELRGHVSFANGSPISQGRVNLAFADGSYGDPKLIAGNYSINTYANGGVTVKATHTPSGLSATALGVLSPTSNDLEINVTLPASGTVSGVVRSSTGVPVANASVRLTSSGLDVMRYATTDVDGRYFFDYIAVGNVTVIVGQDSCGFEVCDFVEIVRANTALLNDGDAVQLDVQLPLLAQLHGQLRGIDGSALPYVGKALRLKMPAGSYAINYFTTTDAEGRFTFKYVVAGIGVLTLDDGNIYSARPVTTVTGIAVTDQMLELNPTVQLDFGYGHQYGWSGTAFDIGNTKINCTGMIGDGYSNPGPLLAEAFGLSVDGTARACDQIADITRSTREIQLASRPFASAVLTRRNVFTPIGDAYIRIHDEFENSGSVPVTVTVTLTDTYARQSQTIAASYLATNGRYKVMVGTLYGFPDDPASSLAMVWCGDTAASRCPVLSNQSASAGGTALWTLTIAPGQKQSLVTFAVKRDAAPANVSFAATISAQTAVDMFDGLSAQERARVVNFATP